MLVFCIIFDDFGYIIDLFDVVILFLERLFFDELWIIIEIKIEYVDNNELYSVLCLSDDYIWMCGNEKIMKFVSF